MSRQKQHQICTSRYRERFQACFRPLEVKAEFLAGQDVDGSFEVDSNMTLNRPSSIGVEV